MGENVLHRPCLAFPVPTTRLVSARWAQGFALHLGCSEKQEPLQPRAGQPLRQFQKRARGSKVRGERLHREALTSQDHKWFIFKTDTKNKDNEAAGRYSLARAEIQCVRGGCLDPPALPAHGSLEDRRFGRQALLVEGWGEEQETACPRASPGGNSQAGIL